MDEQHLADYYEDVVIARDINYPNVKKGLEITRQFIIKNNLILIGGMSIDLALKAKNKDGIYRDDKLPDYDFVSPDSIEHSTQLGKYLCKKGLPNISIINAIHTTTRRVRIDFISVADIGYCPKNIFDTLPYIEYRDIKIIHPHFQMMDIHHSLSFPYENPTMPVVSHRWKRDMKRYDLLFDAYPIKKSATPKLVRHEEEKKILSGSCITGWAALSYWKNGSISVPKGEPIHLLSDDFERIVKLSSSAPIYTESRFGKMPRSVSVTIGGTSYEIFDNLGEKVSAEKVGTMYVANLQHVMMLFLVKKYLDPASTNTYYDTGYVDALTMVTKSQQPGIAPSINIYGRAAWSEAYIINRRAFVAKIKGIKLIRPDRPDNAYPAAPKCKAGVIFDYKKSIYFSISGRNTDPFVPKKLEFFGEKDIVTMSDSIKTKSGGGEEKSDSPENKCAWVTLIMIGTQYMPGAITLAYSLRKAKTQHDIVCMVTPDIDEKSKTQLSAVFDRVIEVQYLKYQAAKPKSKKQQQMYGSWTSRSCTKWQCLKLTEYEKVMFIDADQLVLQNNDELFDLQAPAGTFSTPWISPWYNSKIPNPYGQLAHGERVEPELIQKALKLGSVPPMASLVLLDPSDMKISEFTEFMEDNRHINSDNVGLSGSDEIAIAAFAIEKKLQWTQIHPSFQAVPSKPDWLDGEKARSYHFIGRKPWDADHSEWDDIRVWWNYADELLKLHPQLKTVFYSESVTLISAELAEYRLTMDLNSIIVSKSGNRSHRNQIEIQNIMERWLISMSNTPKKSGWANVYRQMDEPDEFYIKMRNELVEKRIMHDEDAKQLIADIMQIVNNRLSTIPRDIDAEIICTDNEIHYGGQYNVLNVTRRLRRLVKIGSCKDVLRVAMRYDTILSSGQQWGIPQYHVDYLYARWNVRNEAFASPINSRLLGKKNARFCSLFPDIDAPFGSVGSFLNPDLNLSGNWIVNPPFVESIMVSAAQVVLDQLANKKKQTFFFIIPAWKDSPVYKMLHESKSNRSELELLPGTYFFEDPNGQEKWTNAASIYFAMSNDNKLDFKPALEHILKRRRKKSFVVKKH